MRHICSAVVLAQLIAATAVEARAEISCSPQAAGVSGVIADRKDMIASLNCFGQQLAEAAGQAVDRRLGALERNVADIPSPLATRPW